MSSFKLTGWESGSPVLGTEKVLPDGIPAGDIHNGSRVAFGPDGYLWATFGDTGPGEPAQRMDSLAGKVLRMTVDGQPAPGNPFPDRPYLGSSDGSGRSLWGRTELCMWPPATTTEAGIRGTETIASFGSTRQTDCLRTGGGHPS